MIQVSVETTSSLGRRISITVPAEEVEKEIKARLASISKTVKIEGFRPGKVPSRIVEQRYGNAARSEAIEKLIQSTLTDALVEEKLQPAEPPLIDSIKAEPGQPLEYTAGFEVYPEVKLQNLSDITLEKRVVKITEDDVNRVLNQIRKQHASWNIVDRAAEDGDRVTFDLHWTDPNDPAKVGEQKNIIIAIEEGGTPAEFVTIKGTKTGDEVKLMLPLQGDPNANTIPGVAKILKVEAPELPVLDDKLAKQLDVENGVEGLRTEVQKHMEIQLEDTLKNELKTQVIEQFLARHPLELPKDLVEKETRILEQELRAQLRQQIPQNADIPLPENVRENLSHQARRRVTLSILFAALAKEYPLQIDNARIKKRVEQIAASFQAPANVAESLFKDKNIISRIRSQVLEEQLVEKLLEQVKYAETTVAYADVIKMQGPRGAPAIGTGHEHHDHGHEHHHEHQHEHHDH